MAAPPPPPDRGSIAPPSSAQDEDLATVGIPPSAAAAPPPPVPAALAEDAALMSMIAGLEDWAKTNQNEARWESARFWSLKLPAIFGSISTGVFGYLGWELVSLSVGALVAGCVSIDLLNPAGKLRNVHLRAAHDLRNLQHQLVASWSIESRNKTQSERDELAAKLMRRGERERARVAEYLRDAETKLDEAAEARE